MTGATSGGVTRVLLVRHGQSEWNLTGRWQGQADPPLTDLGRDQAQAAARRLGTVDAIWSSDLQRAAETAAIISSELGVGPVVIDVDLRERNAGEWQGLTRAQIDEQYPGHLTPLEGNGAEAGWKPLYPPSWESDTVLAGRVWQAFRRIRDEVGPGEVLVVAHAGVLHTIERQLGASGSGVPNLAGRWVDLLPAPTDDTLSAGCRLGDRIILLDEDELTLPKQI